MAVFFFIRSLSIFKDIPCSPALDKPFIEELLWESFAYCKARLSLYGESELYSYLGRDPGWSFYTEWYRDMS